MILALLAIPILAALALAGYPLLQNSQEEPPPQVAVPDLVGKTLEEAEKEIGNDFKIEVRDEVESEKPVDTILSQQLDDLGQRRRDAGGRRAGCRGQGP